MREKSTMNKLVVSALLAGVAGIAGIAACSSTKQKVHLIDSGTGLDGTSGACNLIMQTGCAVGEKCTWFHDDMSDPPIGHIGCAPAGSAAVDSTCAYGAPGVTGYDDCQAGLVCLTHRDGTASCATICDAQTGSGCGSSDGCVRTSGLFASPGTVDPTIPGTCVKGCDPTLDNDYDGSGSAFSKRTGSPCGTDPAIGCYGVPSSSGHTTFFFCANPAKHTTGTTWDTSGLLHRDEIPTGEVFLNSCHPGYAIAWANDSQTTSVSRCYSFCKPGNSFGSMGSGSAAVPTTQLPNGQVGAQCRQTSGGRLGNFGNIPNGTATSNGEHCMYSWYFEIDRTNQTILPSATSNTVGLCFDHEKYQYDSNGDGSADAPIPPCASLPNIGSAGDAIDARAIACVDLQTGQVVQSPAVGHAVKVPEALTRFNFLTVPSLDPRFRDSVMRKD